MAELSQERYNKILYSTVLPHTEASFSPCLYDEVPIRLLYPTVFFYFNTLPFLLLYFTVIYPCYSKPS